MKDEDKLRVLIPHWIDHNKAHQGEFYIWAGRAGEASEDITAAANVMEQVNVFLTSALEKLGGPLPHHH